MPALPRRRRRASAPQMASSRLHTRTDHAVVDCGVYMDGTRTPGEVTYLDAIRRVRSEGRGFVWLGLLAPDAHQMASLASEFGIHELITEDATNGAQRPKLEAYDDALVLNLAAVEYLAHDTLNDVSAIVSTGEAMVILGRDFVVTVRHGEFGELAGIRSELEKSPDRLAQGPASVMHAVADRMIDSYLEVADEIRQDVDELETALFQPRADVDIEQIYLLKREILELKHNISPLTRPLQRLSLDHLELVPREIRHYFRDVQDHHARAVAEVAVLDEQMTSLVGAAVAMVGVRQNTDMRRISAWVAIAAVPTMIAGVYGMNFENMPELNVSYAYFLVLAIMAGICVGLFWIFRKNDWL
ncbi:magnesium/cobalt transporter CorA [Dietzia aurantiaca]